MVLSPWTPSQHTTIHHRQSLFPSFPALRIHPSRPARCRSYPRKTRNSRISVVHIRNWETPGDTLEVERTGQVPIDHAPDSEPENVAIGRNGELAVALQETNEVFLDQIPGLPCFAAQQDCAMALDDASLAKGVSGDGLAGGAPDGLAFSSDDEARWLAVTLEDTARLLIIDPATRKIVANHDLTVDVPSDYNRDRRAAPKKVHEPEQIAFVRSQASLFVLVTLQESHSVIAYRISEDDGQPVFDSIAVVGVGWRNELGGTRSSNIGPEGIDALPDWGPDHRTLVLTANEREGSVTLLRSSCLQAD